MLKALLFLNRGEPLVYVEGTIGFRYGDDHVLQVRTLAAVSGESLDTKDKRTERKRRRK